MDRIGLCLSIFLLCTVIAESVGNVTPEVKTSTGSSEQFEFISSENDTKEHSGDHGNHSEHHGNHTNHHAAGHHGIHVVSWNYEYVESPLIIVLFVIVTAVCRLGFHHIECLSNRVPESCLLIILGSSAGLMMRNTAAGEIMVQRLDPRLFFLFLLPQIILESAYSLHDRVFFANLGTILLYAVIGTLLNWIIIGAALYGLSLVGAYGNLSLAFIPCTIFSALIVAVDPVAVLAIFQEIGVNNVLYFLVFGESLLNDAVTVVLYNTMKTLNLMDNITADQIFLAFVAFFTVSLGGLSIGILYGLITSFLTKYTTKVKAVEPLLIFALAYASYLTAELFHFSGIISIIGCGLVQAQYAFHNIGHKSLTTVIYFSKLLSSTSDSVIFLFLGLSLVSANHQWNTGFVVSSVILCLVVRFLGVFCLTFLANKFRLRTIDYEEQFIMAYGGLRGAVAFSLVAMLNIPEQNIFETATLVIIIFTVFLQGITIKPLVKLLRIKTAVKENKHISTEIVCHVVDHVVAGIEEILGLFGRNAFREFFGHYDDKYLKHWFQRVPQTKDESILEVYEETTVRHHYEAIQTKPDESISRSQEDSAAAGMNTVGRTMYGSIPENSSDFSHRSLDVKTTTRRRTNQTSLPNKRHSVPNPETHAPPEFERFLSAPEDTSAPNARSRWNALSRVFSRGASMGSSQEFKANPTAGDFRIWAVKLVRESMGQKHDKNLIRENENDLVHHLEQKDLRLKRMKTSNMRQSMTSVRTPSPYTSREVLAGAAQKSKFETIAESKEKESIEMEEKN